MPDKESGVEKIGRGLRSLASTVKDYAPVAKGVAKTFFLGTAGSGSEKDIDYSPGPTPKPKTPSVPKDWYRDSSQHGTPSYKDGTDYVPETGPAILHEGEKVVSKDKNMEDKVSKVASALGSAGRASGIQADDSSAAGLAAKQENIDEYKSSFQTPASEPKPVTSRKDKINPKAKYGDRPGEQRIDVSGVAKKLPSYEDGVDSVPEDGPAMLHQGEKIVPQEENPDAEAKPETRMKAAMGGKKKLAAKKGSKKKSHKITVHKSANGGVVLEHHFDGGKSEMHHHPDFNSAAESMAPHFDTPGASPSPGSSEGGPGTQMASPTSFEDGGVVEKSGQAQVHEGEVVVPKDQAHKVFQNPDITIGGKPAPKTTPKPHMTPQLGKKMKDFDEGGWRVEGQNIPRVPGKV